MRRIAFLAGLLICTAPAGAADVFPTEVWPSDGEVQNLGGTTHQSTGLPYIAAGTTATSTPPLSIQYDRREARQNAIIAIARQLQVVKTGSAAIGVYPGDYVLNGTRKHYDGVTSAGSFSGTQTYYAYLDNANVLQVTTAGWPADISQFAPLAEIAVTSGAVSSIADRRNWSRTIIPQTGGASIDGTDQVYFILDQDNGGAEANSELRANRGSTAGDAALRWQTTGTLWEALANRDAGTFSPFRALTFTATASTGTAPFTITSTTVVSNLNADTVDGIGFGSAPAAANAIPYSTSTSAAGWTAAAAAADVLYANGSGVPTWGALGSTSGVQAWDAELDAVAAIATEGVLCRTGAGTIAARTIAAGSSITVTNGDGVSGAPTISVSGITEHAVAIGTAAGAITPSSVGTDNTVFVGRTGNLPTFRKLLDADIDATAAISASKLASGITASKITAGGNPAYEGTFLGNDLGGEALFKFIHGVTALVTDYSIPANDNEGVFTNQGATTKPEATLPPASYSLCFHFYVQDADGLRISAESGDTIRIAGTVSAAAGYIESTTVGNAVTLVGINATEWVALSSVGTWTFGP